MKTSTTPYTCYEQYKAANAVDNFLISFIMKRLLRHTGICMKYKQKIKKDLKTQRIRCQIMTIYIYHG